jgi:hypothetical protein
LMFEVIADDADDAIAGDLSMADPAAPPAS